MPESLDERARTVSSAPRGLDIIHEPSENGSSPRGSLRMITVDSFDRANAGCRLLTNKSNPVAGDCGSPRLPNDASPRVTN